MTLATLDTAAVARALALIAPGDEIADVYYERASELELADAEIGPCLRRERGLAARLVRGSRSWLAARDDDSPAELAEALRAVARALPPAFPSPEPFAEEAHAAPSYEAVAAFPGRLERALRRRLVGFPYRLAVRWHQRQSRVVTTRTASPVEHEAFASLDLRAAWGRAGEVATALDDDLAERFAERLALRFKARDAAPPEASHPPLLLSPAATAVALHEAIAHALEADLLALSGDPGAAQGVRLSTSALDVLDDPSSAPESVRRTVDDEGVPTTRRWLVRGGRAQQPIADLNHARRFGALLPGSGFRARRHQPPLPRTLHLELLAGVDPASRLFELADGGLAVAELTSGALDPASGRFTLEAPGARRVRGGELAEPVGRFTIRGRVSALLDGFVAVGNRRESAGAGWCAKAGQRRAVWATVPAVVVAGLEVEP
jgi:predicted Zn-dependent protease